jgi:hypothetical protein
MRDQVLGTLKKLDVRDLWQSEASDFTPWLARAENLKRLGDAIGMELEFEAQEKNVGPFRADILCKDTETSHWVLIENQLGRTDHSHLGQLLTYAAGLEAVTIIWIAAAFTEEHRATLDWLNKITDDEFKLFGLEIELWRIGDSLPAPKFNVISKPNDWTSSVSHAARGLDAKQLSETKALQLEFWIAFREYLIRSESPLTPQKPYPQHWTYFRVGRSGFLLEALLNTQANRIGVGLTMNDDNAKPHFALLHEQKAGIEGELGFQLEWMPLPEKKAARLAYFKENIDPLDQTLWPTNCEWMKMHLEKMYRVLRPRIAELDAGEWEPQQTLQNEDSLL